MDDRKVDDEDEVDAASLQKSVGRVPVTKPVAAAAAAAAHNNNNNNNIKKNSRAAATSTTAVEDADLALARKLQASYDRENNAWTNMDRRRKRKQQLALAGPAGNTKKITSFFSKKK
jgi:hypothetical protein